MLPIIPPDTVVVFQGDSITDAGRNNTHPYYELGFGYAMITAGMIWARHSRRNITFYNRGVSGDTVVDLEARWQQDTIALNPNFVSILIGINDALTTLGPAPESLAQFESAYNNILQQTQAIDAQILIMEPYVLPVEPNYAQLREALNPRIDITRQLARDYGAIYVPLDGLLAAKSTEQPPSFWAFDGIHPGPAGNSVIANAWLDATGMA